MGHNVEYSKQGSYLMPFRSHANTDISGSSSSGTPNRHATTSCCRIILLTDFYQFGYSLIGRRLTL